MNVPWKPWWVPLWALAGLLTLTGGFVALVGCSSSQVPQQDNPKKGPTVRVAPVRADRILRTLELTGEITAVNTVVIAATVEGPISFCPWREGDQVARGEKLIEIDREAYRAEMESSRAALAVAGAKLEDLTAETRPEQISMAEEDVHEWEELTARAAAQFARAEKLLAPGGVSREYHEGAEAGFKAAQAKLAATRSQLEMLRAGATPTAIAVQQALVREAAAVVEVARARLAECIITSPFEGTIVAVHVRPGDLAVPRAALLEIHDLSSLVLRFAVPEAYGASVQPDMTVDVALDAYPGRPLRARVTRVYPRLDSVMRTRTVEAQIVEPVELVPGMFARLALHLESVADALVVPQEAVLVTPQGQKVLFVIQDGKASQRKVVTGIEQGGIVQLLEGARAGEQAVIAGNEKLKDGMSVAIAGAGGGPGGTSGGGPGAKLGGGADGSAKGAVVSPAGFGAGPGSGGSSQ